MVVSIPKHLLEKISLLYSEYKTDNFTFQDAVKTLGQNERYTGLILSKLGNAGWIGKKRDSKDKRKKIYQIRDIHEIIEKIGQKLHEKQK